MDAWAGLAWKEMGQKIDKVGIRTVVIFPTPTPEDFSIGDLGMWLRPGVRGFLKG